MRTVRASRAGGIVHVAPSLIAIDEARARISVLGLLIGHRNVSFRIDAFDGVIKGTYEESSKSRDIDVEFDGVDMARVDAIAQNVGFPLDGKLNGELKLALPEGKASKGNGNVNLVVNDMAAGKGAECWWCPPSAVAINPARHRAAFGVSSIDTGSARPTCSISMASFPLGARWRHWPC